MFWAFPLAARLINQSGTLCVMARDFTDYIYQGRSAEEFGVVLFSGFFTECSQMEMRHVLVWVVCPCHVQGWMFSHLSGAPSAKPCLLSVIFLNMIPNSFKPSSYTHIISETLQSVIKPQEN